MGRRKRVAIATVVGMLFMALVFLIAIGAQAYITNAQGVAQEAQTQALQRSALRAEESLSFGGVPANLRMTNTGAVTITAVAMLMKFENGSLIGLDGTSLPAFRAAVLPSSESVEVKSLVPDGACAPGGPSCAAVYLAIVDGRAPGRAVGVVTSLGNTFWYVPAAASGGIQDPTAYSTPAVESTSSLNYTGIPGLSFSGGSGAFYEVQVHVGYWQSGPSPNSDMFAVGTSNGTTFMFCGGMDWSAPSGSTTDLSPGNACTSTPGGSLGATWSQENPCFTRQLACEFVGTAYVYFGPSGGTFRLEFEGLPSGQANVFADSVMSVTQLR